MKLVEKRNQKQALNYYKKKLELIHDCCKFSMNLNEMQKDDLISVIDNAIKCCSKMKYEKYIPASFNNNENTVINSEQQYRDYTIMKLMLNNLLSELSGNEFLHQEKKSALKKYLLSMFNHIRAKVNKYERD